MKTLALAGAMFLALLSPAFAVESENIYCDKFDQVVAVFAAAANPVEMLTPEQLEEAMVIYNVPGATRAFFVLLHGEPVFGFEVGGCLLPPVPAGRPAVNGTPS